MRNISIVLAALLVVLLAALPATAQVYNADGQMGMNVPTSDTRAGIWPIATTVASDSLVLKNSAGNVYGFQVTAAPGSDVIALVLDATAKPINGAVTPIKCYVVKANSTTTVSYNPVAMGVTTGAVIAITSSGSCYTLNATNAAFISGEAK